MRWKIRSAVGSGQKNEYDDVKKVQTLLNRASGGQGEMLAEDGIWGPKTMARLADFQKNVVHLRTADAIVNVQGPTWRTLNNSHPASGNTVSQKAQSAPHHVVLVPEGEMADLLKKQAAQPPANHKVAWFNRALPAAINVKAHWGVPISLTLAQGAVESHYGQLAPNNMFFGIKGKSPTGDSVKVTTHEHYNGKDEVIQDSFRAYASLEESAEDYGRFLAAQPRYRAAFAFSDQPEKFIHIVAKAGYATNPSYEKLILKIIRSNGLSDYDTPGMANYVRFTNPLHQ